MVSALPSNPTLSPLQQILLTRKQQGAGQSLDLPAISLPQQPSTNNVAPTIDMNQAMRHVQDISSLMGYGGNTTFGLDTSSLTAPPAKAGGSSNPDMNSLLNQIPGFTSPGSNSNMYNNIIGNLWTMLL